MSVREWIDKQHSISKGANCMVSHIKCKEQREYMTVYREYFFITSNSEKVLHCQSSVKNTGGKIKLQRKFG